MSVYRERINKIGFGGGCHWCTEAVFQSLKGVITVEQGYISSVAPNESFSEGVTVSFDMTQISLAILIEIHLRTHESTKNHSMRHSYRSAIYTFSSFQKEECEEILKTVQSTFGAPLITQVLPFEHFKSSREEITNYYFKDPEKVFCKRYIDPKLQLLLRNYGGYVREDKLTHAIKTL